MIGRLTFLEWLELLFASYKWQIITTILLCLLALSFSQVLVQANMRMKVEAELTQCLENNYLNRAN
jgi:hypothetical protein